MTAAAVCRGRDLVGVKSHRLGIGVNSQRVSLMLRDRLPSYLLVTYLLLCGCATSKPDAPSTYESAVALQNQKSQYTHAWMAKADAAQTAFLLCVKSYAATHQQTTLTATELSGAAISACG